MADHRRSSVKDIAVQAIQTRFGKLLACGMIIACVCGIAMVGMGFYVMGHLGGYITGLKDKIPQMVTTKAAISESGQNIVPLGDVPADIKLGEWQGTIALLLIACGALTVIVAMIGVYSGLAQNKLLLIVTVLLLVITAALLLFLLFIFSDSDGSFHTSAKAQLLEILKKEYVVETANNVFVFAFNAIMLWFECCGVIGVRDFANITFVQKMENKPNMPYNFQVPPACCKRKYFNTKTTVPVPFDGIKNCAVVAYSINDNIQTLGCYGVVFNSVQNSIVAILAIFMVWNIIVLVLAILAITEIRPESEVVARTPSVTGERRSVTKQKKLSVAAPVVVVKRFVPMAKVSSYNHPDINRVKSTEIW